MSPEFVSTRPLLDKLGVKPGARVAVVDVDDPSFIKLLRTRTKDRLAGTLFGERRYAETLIAEIDREPVGFALFFHSFSTFLAQPGIYLEDLYVAEERRGQGVGRALLARLAQLAVDRDCGRLE